MDWPIAIAQGWHPVAMERDVTVRKTHRSKLLGQDLVLFRSGNQIVVFKDRCPHRGIPLSRGTVNDGIIACPYHGWRFGPDGECVAVPGATACPQVSATVVPVTLAGGLVWVNLAENPAPFPNLPDAINDTALDRFWWKLDPSRAGLLDALENHLDPAHPHYVHPWLVRSPQRRRLVEVDIRSGPWGAEAIYIEQRRNLALLSSVMEGRRSRSIGKLWPPSIGEVRLESERGGLLSITVVFAPEDEGWTRPWAHFATRKGLLPAWFKRSALKAFHWPVLQQDRRMLRFQQEARTGEPYKTGPLDVLSQAIWAHANQEICAEGSRSTQMYL